MTKCPPESWYYMFISSLSLFSLIFLSSPLFPFLWTAKKEAYIIIIMEPTSHLLWAARKEAYLYGANIRYSWMTRFDDINFFLLSISCNDINFFFIIQTVSQSLSTNHIMQWYYFFSLFRRWINLFQQIAHLTNITVYFHNHLQRYYLHKIEHVQRIILLFYFHLKLLKIPMRCRLVLLSIITMYCYTKLLEFILSIISFYNDITMYMINRVNGWLSTWLLGIHYEILLLSKFVGTKIVRTEFNSSIFIVDHIKVESLL